MIKRAGIPTNWTFEQEIQYLANKIYSKILDFVEFYDLGKEQRTICDIAESKRHTAHCIEAIYKIFHVINPLQADMWYATTKHWNQDRQLQEIEHYLNGQLEFPMVQRTPDEIREIIHSKELSGIYESFDIEQFIRNTDSYVANPELEATSIASLKHELSSLGVKRKIHCEECKVLDIVDSTLLHMGIKHPVFTIIESWHGMGPCRWGRKSSYFIVKKLISRNRNIYRFQITWCPDISRGYSSRKLKSQTVVVDVAFGSQFKGAIYESVALSSAIEYARDYLYHSGNHGADLTNDSYFMTPVRDILRDMKRNIVKI